MSDEDLEYYRRFPSFYYELIRESINGPNGDPFRKSIRDASPPETFLEFDQTQEALRQGVARGMEWLGAYGQMWARLVYLKRIEVGREISVEEERAIRQLCWQDYLKTAANRQVRPYPVLDDEDLKFGAYFTGDLPWPREPSLGKFENSLSKGE